MIRQTWTKPAKLRDREPPPLPAVKPETRGTYAHTETVAKAKEPHAVNPHLRNLARGEACTGLLYGSYCHCDPASTVLAHTNTLSDQKGMGYKGHDFQGAFLGFDCHAWLDQGKARADEKAVFMANAQSRTRARWAEIANDTTAKPWKRLAAQWALTKLEEKA
jgi:hypothetical protein